MKFFLDCRNTSASARLIYFNEFLFTKVLIAPNKKRAAYPTSAIRNLIWKKPFMGQTRRLSLTNYFNLLKPTKLKILVFLESVILNKTYFFYSSFNQTNFFNLSFYFSNKILYFTYFFNKMQFLHALFLILNFKSFYFLRNSLGEFRTGLTLLNSKFI